MTVLQEQAEFRKEMPIWKGVLKGRNTKGRMRRECRQDSLVRAMLVRSYSKGN